MPWKVCSILQEIIIFIYTQICLFYLGLGKKTFINNFPIVLLENPGEKIMEIWESYFCMHTKKLKSFLWIFFMIKM